MHACCLLGALRHLRLVDAAAAAALGQLCTLTFVGLCRPGLVRRGVAVHHHLPDLCSARRTPASAGTLRVLLRIMVGAACKGTTGLWLHAEAQLCVFGLSMLYMYATVCISCTHVVVLAVLACYIALRAAMWCLAGCQLAVHSLEPAGRLPALLQHAQQHAHAGDHCVDIPCPAQ